MIRKIKYWLLFLRNSTVVCTGKNIILINKIYISQNQNNTYINIYKLSFNKLKKRCYSNTYS